MKLNRKGIFFLSTLLGTAIIASSLISIAIGRMWVTWHKTPIDTRDGPGLSVALGLDGDVYVTGSILISGDYNTDVFIARYDAGGNQRWYRTYGGGLHDDGNGIAVASDGCIYVAGASSKIEEGGHLNAFILKYNGTGTMIWARSFGWENDLGFRVAVVNENIYLAGTIFGLHGQYTTPLLVKYDVDGNQIWNRTCDLQCNYGLVTLAVGEDGSVYLAGQAFGDIYGITVAYIIKYDVLGNHIWNSSWRDVGNEGISGITVSGDGSFYVSAYTDTTMTGYQDVLIVKYDAAGNQVWNQTWNGGNYDVGSCITLLPDGSVLLVGETHFLGSVNNDVFIVNYDAAGNYLWCRIYGTVEHDIVTGIALAPDGDFYLTGSTGRGNVRTLYLAKIPGRAPESTMIVTLLITTAGTAVPIIVILLHSRKGNINSSRSKETLYQAK